MKKLLLSCAMVAVVCSPAFGGMAHAAEGAALSHMQWSFAGPFGTYDKAALQRGYKIYREVCAFNEAGSVP